MSKLDTSLETVEQRIARERLERAALEEAAKAASKSSRNIWNALMEEKKKELEEQERLKNLMKKKKSSSNLGSPARREDGPTKSQEAERGKEQEELKPGREAFTFWKSKEKEQDLSSSELKRSPSSEGLRRSSSSESLYRFSAPLSPSAETEAEEHEAAAAAEGRRALEERRTDALLDTLRSTLASMQRSASHLDDLTAYYGAR